MSTSVVNRASGLRWFHFVEIIFPIYTLIVFPLVVESVFDPSEGYVEFAQFSIISFFVLIATIPLLAIIALAVLRYIIGKNDTRYKIILHGIPAMVSVAFAADYGAFYPPRVGIDQIDTYFLFFIITLAIPVVIYIIIAFIAIFSTYDPITKEFDLLRSFINQGDFGKRVENQEILRDSIFGPLTIIMNDILSTMEENLNAVKSSNTLLQTSSDELFLNVDSLSSATEEVTSSSQSMAQGASAQSESLNRTLEETNSIVDNMAQIITEIESKTNLVGQISLQTNILALNAGIEASRAGDYGRGFAVVAENVRRLSEEAKQASESIEEVVNDVFSLIQDQFTTIQDQVQNIATISEETAAGAEEVAATMEEINSNIYNIAELANKLKENRNLTSNND